VKSTNENGQAAGTKCLRWSLA